MALAAILAAALAFTGADATNACVHAAELVARHTPRDAGTTRGRSAAYWILDRASAFGAEARLDLFTAETPKGRRQFANVTAEFRADPARPWTVLVSHFDTKPGSGCPGANDGASTTGLLIALCSTLRRARSLGGNVLLVWTDSEECMGTHYTAGDGFQGSRHAAERLKRRGLDVRAVICLDMLGDRDLNIKIPLNVTPALADVAQTAAGRCGLGPRTVSRGDILVKDDHLAFLEAGYPAVALIDFEYGSRPGANDYWHTAEDTMEHVSAESLEKSGRLVVEMLKILGI